MTTRPSAYRSTTWLITAVFLIGVIVLGAGLAAGSAAVIIVGGALALAAAACGVVLPRRGMSAPISFSKEWPPTTPGPRGRHTDPPRIDTEPKAPPRPPPPLMTEIHGKDAPHFPDRERSFAQHFNLDPHERLHIIEGQPYIELDLDEGEEDETLGGKIYRPTAGAGKTGSGAPGSGTTGSGTTARGTTARGTTSRPAGPGTVGTTAVEEPASQTVAAPAEAMPGERPAGSGAPATVTPPAPPQMPAEESPGSRRTVAPPPEPTPPEPRSGPSSASPTASPAAEPEPPPTTKQPEGGGATP